MPYDLGTVFLVLKKSPTKVYLPIIVWVKSDVQVAVLGPKSTFPLIYYSSYIPHFPFHTIFHHE